MGVVSWEGNTEVNFRRILAKIPVFLRPTAEKKVKRKAESLAQKDNRALVIEKDLVDAFIAETPFGFHGPLKNDFKEFGIDYVKYGYDK